MTRLSRDRRWPPAQVRDLPTFRPQVFLQFGSGAPDRRNAMARIQSDGCGQPSLLTNARLPSLARRLSNLFSPKTQKTAAPEGAAARLGAGRGSRRSVFWCRLRPCIHNQPPNRLTPGKIDVAHTQCQFGVGAGERSVSLALDRGPLARLQRHLWGQRRDEGQGRRRPRRSHARGQQQGSAQRQQVFEHIPSQC